jgi:hypothetical protein
MVTYASVSVIKGLGGDCVRMFSVGLSVTALVTFVEDQTDWLWGIGSAYELRDLDSFAALRWDHVFSTDVDTVVMLLYLPHRVTSKGFPCWQCWGFVYWTNPRWYTRYFETSHLPIQTWMGNSEWAEVYKKFFYEPREYYCSDCGPWVFDPFSRIECVEIDPITNRKTYTSFTDWLQEL